MERVPVGCAVEELIGILLINALITSATEMKYILGEHDDFDTSYRPNQRLCEVILAAIRITRYRKISSNDIRSDVFLLTHLMSSDIIPSGAVPTSTKQKGDNHVQKQASRVQL